MRLFLLFITILFFGFVPLAQAGMIDYPTVKLQVLDKSMARTMTLEAKVGSTIEYGSAFIKVQACRKSEPLDKPESASFLQIWEIPINSDKSEWIFSGWMFASSPALSAMNHPVYDVWVLDCIDKNKKKSVIKKVKTDKKEGAALGESTTDKSKKKRTPKITIEEDDVISAPAAASKTPDIEEYPAETTPQGQ